MYWLSKYLDLVYREMILLIWENILQYAYDVIHTKISILSDYEFTEANIKKDVYNISKQK